MYEPVLSTTARVAHTHTHARTRERTHTQVGGKDTSTSPVLSTKAGVPGVEWKRWAGMLPRTWGPGTGPSPPGGETPSFIRGR